MNSVALDGMGWPEAMDLSRGSARMRRPPQANSRVATPVALRKRRRDALMVRFSFCFPERSFCSSSNSTSPAVSQDEPFQYARAIADSGGASQRTSFWETGASAKTKPKGMHLSFGKRFWEDWIMDELLADFN